MTLTHTQKLEIVKSANILPRFLKLLGNKVGIGKTAKPELSPMRQQIMQMAESPGSKIGLNAPASTTPNMLGQYQKQ